MRLVERIQQIHQQIPMPWIIAIVMLVFFFAFSLRHKDDPRPDPYASGGFPQYYMTNIETREYGASGNLRYRLTTPQITHFQKDTESPSEHDYTMIESPTMEFFDEDPAAPWIVNAREGKSQMNGELIQLLNDVEIQQHTPSNGLVRISTSKLDLLPKTQFARTDKAVKMRSAKGQMTAEGMEADFTNSQFQLKSQVKAVYEPR
uniref:LPS export ABC transporter periplasmic protein LptC n=1 Tax=Cellvibrio fontiphilus TaxID=1815559 RepID=UPI002B4C1AF8|nr:LPS export ABC transporter periplasmic protein LptC [Cellvibrio fontiphilus]